MVSAADIAGFLGIKLFGHDIEVIYPCSLENTCIGGLIFVKSYSEKIVDLLKDKSNLMAIAKPEYANKLECSYVLSNNPRLDFARVIQQFFSAPKVAGVADSVKVGNNVMMGEGIMIGEYCVIGDDVVIGDRTEIRHHVVISSGTIIGNDCLIKSNTVIGEEGFGFERDENGVPIRIPHLGKVVIGNAVEIGALNTVMRGTLNDTIIGDNLKTDDHVHIGHNVKIGINCLITACSEISGSVEIGNDCWLGPNCSVINGICIGNNCFIGLGTVVNKSLPENVVVAGSPARILRENKR